MTQVAPRDQILLRQGKSNWNQSINQSIKLSKKQLEIGEYGTTRNT